MSPVLSLNTIISALTCLCSSNIDAVDTRSQDGLDNVSKPYGFLKCEMIKHIGYGS